MDDMNQTLVPEAFMSLYLRHGRPTASRAVIEQRHELAEDLALHIAGLPEVSGADGQVEQTEALERCRAGLMASPAQVSDQEAGWVVHRVAELLEWRQPEERKD